MCFLLVLKDFPDLFRREFWDMPELRWRGRYPKLTRLIESLAEKPSLKATQPGMMDVDITANMS